MEGTKAMKVLMTCGLLETYVRTTLTPLIRVPRVERVWAVRTWPGPEMPKVEYISPPRLVSRGLVGKLLKPFVMFAAACRRRADLVFGVYLHPHGMTAIAVARLFRKPSVLSIIGSDLHIYLRGRPLWRAVMLPFVRAADVVTVTGRESLDELAALGIPRDRLYVLPNSVDLDRFAPRDDIPKEYDLIFVARLVPGKQPRRFLDLVAEVRRRRGEVRAVVLGDGPEMAATLAYAESLGLRERVSFPGLVDNVEDYLFRSRLFVLPTLGEGLPRSAVEAMACGVPCVISDVGNVRDLVQDGENGILVPDF
jgi:glycosyltransferase involved in cell wall biosynthesis